MISPENTVSAYDSGSLLGRHGSGIEQSTHRALIAKAKDGQFL
jgi:hypothetical protein